MTDCIFCKIIAGDIPSTKIYEDEDVYVFADIHPVNLGHSLVVPKMHFENLYSTPEGELAKIMRVAKRVAIASKEALRADGINIEMNNEPAAGQVIFHSHIHVIPRFANDGYRHWKGPERSPEEVAETAERVKKNLEMEP